MRPRAEDPDLDLALAPPAKLARLALEVRLLDRARIVRVQLLEDVPLFFRVWVHRGLVCRLSLEFAGGLARDALDAGEEELEVRERKAVVFDEVRDRVG